MIGRITIDRAVNGYIVKQTVESNVTEGKIEQELYAITGNNDTEIAISLLQQIKELVGVEYNKYSEESQNIYIVKGPGHKADNFDKFYEIVYGKDEETDE